ncbi:hypothetical protein EDB83DRAFT_2320022 [Lactarius deliciosus]|nr:hypothetical protein EDB83DRAFT_2320022 [Lactarius deliciosus]
MLLSHRPKRADVVFFKELLGHLGHKRNTWSLKSDPIKCVADIVRYIRALDARKQTFVGIVWLCTKDDPELCQAKPLELIQHVKTQWDSVYLMLECFHFLQKPLITALKPLVTALSLVFINILRDLLSLVNSPLLFFEEPPELGYRSKVASLELTLDPEDQLVEVERRVLDNLPAHVKGTAYWKTSLTDRQGGYYCVIKNQVAPVEFINDAWYGLERRGFDFFTKDSYRISRDNVVGLGWWDPADPENPEQLLTPRAPSPANLPPDDEETKSTEEPVDNTLALEVDILTTALSPIAPLQGLLPLTTNTPAPVILPQITATITSGPTPITTIPPTAPPMASGSRAAGGKLSGNTPTTFDGDRSKSKKFTREFDLYRGMNEESEIMKSPYQ